MRIIFDLDGVLRDINAYLRARLGIPEIKEWYWKYKGRDIYDWVKFDNYCSLVYSPPTPYFYVVEELVKFPCIWTSQPEEWKVYTKAWLRYYFGREYSLEYLSLLEKRERLDEDKSLYLVEDYPFFDNYNRILLVDKPYNQAVKTDLRIKTVMDLGKWIEREQAEKQEVI